MGTIFPIPNTPPEEENQESNASSTELHPEVLQVINEINEDLKRTYGNEPEVKLIVDEDKCEVYLSIQAVDNGTYIDRILGGETPRGYVFHSFRKANLAHERLTHLIYFHKGYKIKDGMESLFLPFQLDRAILEFDLSFEQQQKHLIPFPMLVRIQDRVKAEIGNLDNVRLSVKYWTEIEPSIYDIHPVRVSNVLQVNAKVTADYVDPLTQKIVEKVSAKEFSVNVGTLGMNLVNKKRANPDFVINLEEGVFQEIVKAVNSYKEISTVNPDLGIREILSSIQGVSNDIEIEDSNPN